MKLAERPPSSPSRFDLKTRHYRSQSQHQMYSLIEKTPEPPETPIGLFEIVHRPPSQNHVRFSRQNTDIPSISFKSSSFIDEKTYQKQQQQLNNKQKLLRPQTAIPSVPTTYEVKRGSKIYKVIVGYVSPYTSPLQRKELHLKTDGEVNTVIKQIKEQQEKQRASKPQVWLGLSPENQF